MLVAALSTESGDIEGLGSMIMVLVHFFVVLVAFPFLWYTLYPTETIARWFRNAIFVMSCSNAVLMLISSAAVSGDRSQFVFFALLELIPVFLLYRRRDFVIPKKIIVPS